MPDTEPWPFDQGPNVAAITTVNVLERGAPILRVRHYADDDSWAFVCGLTDDDADGRVIAMRTALEIDRTLRELADLPPGWRAWRERAGAAWQRVRDEAPDGDEEAWVAALDGK
jgi:hypothetical protein